MGNDQTSRPEQTADTADTGDTGDTGYVTDDQLPGDLVPGEDNPLAERADEGESAIDPDIEPGGARERPYEKRPDESPSEADDAGRG